MNSVGIIGGADGPTAVIVSEQISGEALRYEPIVVGIAVAIVIAVFAISVAYGIKKFRNNKNSEDK